MIERELKLLLDAQAIKRVQIHYAVMSDGYMVVADGKPLETGKRSLSEILCVRHNMSPRSMYAKQDEQEESGSSAAQHSPRVH